MQEKLFTEVRRISEVSDATQELDLNNWKANTEIITDSLWLIPERDRGGAHTGYLHGNFIPQIPRQAMLRFTRKGDIVVDTFLGSGTTLIECKRLGRHGIGIELQRKFIADSTLEVKKLDYLLAERCKRRM